MTTPRDVRRELDAIDDEGGGPGDDEQPPAVVFAPNEAGEEPDTWYADGREWDVSEVADPSAHFLVRMPRDMIFSPHPRASELPEDSRANPGGPAGVPVPDDETDGTEGVEDA